MNEKQIVIIDGTNVRFGDTSFGAVTSDIKGLKLNYEGVVKEHPDLKDNPEWKTISINRFTEKLKELDTDNDRAEYIIEDLRKHGFKPLRMQKNGFRARRIE